MITRELSRDRHQLLFIKGDMDGLSLLRIDPLANDSANMKYGIPGGNPFVSDPSTPDEIFAWGLRNPFRFSFDRQTGDVYIGDVGQNKWEEVNLQDVSRTAAPANFGWVSRTRPMSPASRLT